jgi:hypothetical protein
MHFIERHSRYWVDAQAGLKDASLFEKVVKRALLHKYLKLLRGKDCQLKALIDQTLYNKAFRRKAESLCNNAYQCRHSSRF